VSSVPGRKKGILHTGSEEGEQRRAKGSSSMSPLRKTLKRFFTKVRGGVGGRIRGNDGGGAGGEREGRYQLGLGKFKPQPLLGQLGNSPLEKGRKHIAITGYFVAKKGEGEGNCQPV